ncbi:aspartate aminotransferase, cytoplasmic-like [Schistocerca piceifrons]|uniref:aspartate aminotransferase, cytoplasmic-like n=1 Tax=Schistocerca piceifrons TaxID=274613 RepID=UPI001F5E3EB4|nr:aspartate aminotransferase, cytoplasmic-like [Schistocerca piceifrons]
MRRAASLIPRSLRTQLSRAMATNAEGSVFDPVQAAPPLELWKVRTGFAQDKSENKVDLGIGAYRTNEGKPWVLPVVKRTEQKVVTDENLNHEYLMILGMDSLGAAATKLLLGEKSRAVLENRAFGVHSLSGTGSLRIGTEFLSKILNYNTAYVSNPSWDNHQKILHYSGFGDIRQYRYWDPATRSLDIDGLINDLSTAPEHSVIILHVCAHNPTGCDPTKEQWIRIADIMQERKLFPYFDAAYLGFASGDLEEDAWPVRYFEERGFELFCAQSFAKNFGLYSERVGNLAIVVKKPQDKFKIQSQFNAIIRPIYQSPPAHGARVVNHILNDPVLSNEWKDCVKIMTKRIQEMRSALKLSLEKLQTPGNWNHITEQKGMFSYTGLTAQQVEYLRDTWHIYLYSSGRANMCGLNTKNVNYVAKAFNDAIRNVAH